MANVHTRSRSGFIMRGGTRRRETEWISVDETSTNLATTNSAALINVGSAAVLALAPFTIVRTKLNCFVRSDQTVALETWQTAIGVAVVSAPASTIGITAVPTPFTDLGSDLWLLHQIFSGQLGFVTGSGFITQPISQDVDSKAMRKVEDGADVAFVVENSSLAGLGSNWTVAGRMLIKLH